MPMILLATWKHIEGVEIPVTGGSLLRDGLNSIRLEEKGVREGSPCNIEIGVSDF